MFVLLHFCELEICNRQAKKEILWSHEMLCFKFNNYSEDNISFKTNIIFDTFNFSKEYIQNDIAYTRSTAFMQPSFSGLFVTCAYFPMVRKKERKY